MEPLKVCLNKQYEVTDDITVWEWTGSAWDEGAEASQWFSDYLGNPTKLVRFNTGSVFETFKNNKMTITMFRRICYFRRVNVHKIRLINICMLCTMVP